MQADTQDVAKVAVSEPLSTESTKRGTSSLQRPRVGHVRHGRGGGGAATASWWPAQACKHLAANWLVSVGWWRGLGVGHEVVGER